MYNRTRPLAVPSSSATGAALDVSDLGEKTIFVWSSGAAINASIQIQISAAGGATAPAANDKSWVSEGAALTANGTLLITKRCNWIQVVVSSYVAGTLVGAVVGSYGTDAGGIAISASRS